MEDRRITDHHASATRPPRDLARCTLRTYPLASSPSEDAPLAAGTILWRGHDAKHDPLWFGPAAGSESVGRFDDPLRVDESGARTFGVCYVGLTRECAFAETLLSRPGVASIDRTSVARRNLAQLLTTRSLRLAAMLGPGLKAMGTDADVAHGSHAITRLWARALWEHPATFDGIAYYSRRDNSEVAIALFDRARDAIKVVDTRPLRDDRAWFGATLDRYLLTLDPP